VTLGELVRDCDVSQEFVNWC